MSWEMTLKQQLQFIVELTNMDYENNENHLNEKEEKNEKRN